MEFETIEITINNQKDQDCLLERCAQGAVKDQDCLLERCAQGAVKDQDVT